MDTIKLIVNPAGHGELKVNNQHLENHVETVDIHVKAGSKPVIVLGLSAISTEIEVQGIVKLESKTHKEKFTNYIELPGEFKVLPFHLLERLECGDMAEAEDFAMYDKELVMKALKWFKENWN